MLFTADRRELFIKGESAKLIARLNKDKADAINSIGVNILEGFNPRAANAFNWPFFFTSVMVI